MAPEFEASQRSVAGIASATPRLYIGHAFRQCVIVRRIEHEQRLHLHPKLRGDVAVCENALAVSAGKIGNFVEQITDQWIHETLVLTVTASGLAILEFP